MRSCKFLVQKYQNCSEFRAPSMDQRLYNIQLQFLHAFICLEQQQLMEVESTYHGSTIQSTRQSNRNKGP